MTTKTAMPVDCQDPAAVRQWCLEETFRIHALMLETGDLAGALRSVKQVAGLAKGQSGAADDDEVALQILDVG